MAAGGSPRQVGDLLTLARARFGGLGPAEVKLLEAAPQGKIEWCGPSDRDDDPANDPAKADAWGTEREIRAGLIRWLCVDREAAKCVDPKGIRVGGAKIVDGLDLSFANVPFPAELLRCRLTHDADLMYARIPALSLIGTWARSITADRINVQGGVFLSKGFTAQGEVRLLGAQIAGNLDCDGGTFKNPGKDALNADGVNVKCDVFLRKDFTASADGVNVQGSVFLSEGFSAEGEVRLAGAQIGGQLSCTGGTFKNPKGKALNADGVKVKGSVFLSEGFSAEGEVRLLVAQIGGQLSCTGGTFTEVSAETATIKGNFFWRDIHEPQATKLNLVNATAGAIVDDEASWPAPGNLSLDGFVYDRFTAGPTGAQKRLQWLARVNQFSLQPYRQLAKVLRETGDSKGARDVLFEMERRRRKHEDRTWYGRLWSHVLERVIGFGLMPWRALIWLVRLAVLGFVVFGLGYFGGAIVPSEKDAYEIFERQGLPPRHYTRFNAAFYSLEHSSPFVNLGQKDHWAPNPQASGREPELEWAVFVALRDAQVGGIRPFRFPWSGALQVFLLFQIVAGWVLATLFIAGLIGIVRAE